MTNKELQNRLAQFDGNAEVMLSALINSSEAWSVEEYDGRIWLS